MNIPLGVAEHFSRHWPRVSTDLDILRDEVVVTLRIGYEELLDAVPRRSVAKRIACCNVRFVARSLASRAARQGLMAYGRKRR